MRLRFEMSTESSVIRSQTVQCPIYAKRSSILLFVVLLNLLLLKLTFLTSFSEAFPQLTILIDYRPKTGLCGSKRGNSRGGDCLRWDRRQR